MITDGCLRINKLVTIRLTPSSGESDVSKGTLSRRQGIPRRIILLPPKPRHLNKGPKGAPIAILPHRLPRLRARQRRSDSIVAPVDKKSIPQKRGADSDIPDTPKVFIRIRPLNRGAEADIPGAARVSINIRPLKRRALEGRNNLQSASDHRRFETVHSDDSFYSECPAGVATVPPKLLDQCGRETCPADPARTAAAAQLASPHTSRLSSPL
ncbi:uncharacterized protein EDB91DRAFT_1149281 [Suillus paluster]|uniref:uncharacterized protein n=1 Tax=Suillus paluster TaxID=48578 RepID=UPI001B882D3B|nr:uncharacterized protein EDB91DRAFT_1149281 [Suillus paluster]KAG1733385.1 hypothetical protein EDB91DRAFT_1149281 [Suillus paluster]